MMTLEQIIAEMHRKPDAGILLDWIYDNDVNGDFRLAIEAYAEAQS